jgi:hypothetical protein
MMETVVEERASQLGEYLQLLRLLATELEGAMRAITERSLSELEESISNQQAVSTRLAELAQEVSRNLRETSLNTASVADGELKDQIVSASATLQQLNRRYSLLVNYSSHSVALMVSLFSSFQGQMYQRPIQEGSGARPKQHTWSCQI